MPIELNEKKYNYNLYIKTKGFEIWRLLNMKISKYEYEINLI